MEMHDASGDICGSHLRVEHILKPFQSVVSKLLSDRRAYRVVDGIRSVIGRIPDGQTGKA